MKENASQGKCLGNVGGSNGDKKKVEPEAETEQAMRPVKLIFGHDIRRAEIPESCGFGQLREVVRKRFPNVEACLIKYQDVEGDLVTITGREEIRMAEAEFEAKRQSAAEAPVAESIPEGFSAQLRENSPELGRLRFHIVECSREQEPPVPEDDEVVEPTEDLVEEEDVEEEDPAEEVIVDKVESTVESAVDPPPENGEVSKAKTEKALKKEDGQPAAEEIGIDDWLFDFAQLFRTHVGIDPDGHVDFHELGMELCSEALEAAVTAEEAQPFFEAAAGKFQEVAALGLFNWGNVYMCAARKRFPTEAAGKTDTKERLKLAFAWAQKHYEMAGKKYEEALKIKPDFYEGVLALGQEKFEIAKLQWGAALAAGVDLKAWDSKETLSLFCFAEERMKTAAEMWDKLEAQQGAQVEAASKSRKEQSKPEAGEDRAGQGEVMEHSAEHSAAMRSQINLFWGNVLFEHSQVEYRVGLPSWKELLDVALEKFVSAGAASEDIEGALKNHPARLNKEKEAGSSTLWHHLASDTGKKVDSNGSMGNAATTKQKLKVERETENKPGVSGR